MSESISFKCIHCHEDISADSEYSGQDATCPGCSKTIVVPKAEVSKEDMLEKYPDLKNRSENELDCSLGFLDQYSKVYCDIQPSEEQHMRVISIAFKKGVGPALVKRYETANFAGAMQGSHKDCKEIQKALFGNKKLNKELNRILTDTGIKLKKKSFFGLF